jgi:acetoin utilization protein AcuB
VIVSMWMTRELVTIESHTSVTAAAALMAEKHIRRLPIVEHHAGDQHPVGLITATDILHAFPPEVNPFALRASANRPVHATVAEIMSRSLQTVPPDAPIEEAARLMRNGKISTLLVTQKMKLVGLITESDIFRAFVSIFDVSQGGARITFVVTKEEDAFGLIAPIALRWGVRVVSLMSVKQGDRELCVVRITGKSVDDMLDELWSSGHSVLNVLRLP